MPEPRPTPSPNKVGRKAKVLERGVCRPCDSDCNGGNAVRSVYHRAGNIAVTASLPAEGVGGAPL